MSGEDNTVGIVSLCIRRAAQQAQQHRAVDLNVQGDAKVAEGPTWNLYDTIGGREVLRVTDVFVEFSGTLVAGIS